MICFNKYFGLIIFTTNLFTMMLRNDIVGPGKTSKKNSQIPQRENRERITNYPHRPQGNFKINVDIICIYEQIETNLNLQFDELIIPKTIWDTQQRIIAHSQFDIMYLLKRSLTTDFQKNLFNHGPFGKFQHLQGTTYPKKLIHLLVLSQVHSEDPTELLFNIGGNVLAFNVYDFELFSGIHNFYFYLHNFIIYNN